MHIYVKVTFPTNQEASEGVDLPIKLCIIEINNKINLFPRNFFLVSKQK